MAVQIQLKNGQIKNYKTWHESSDQEGITYYSTKCKMKFRGKPHELDGCDHIDCAIISANWAKDECRLKSKIFVSAGVLWIIIAIVMIIIDSDYWWAALMFTVMSMIFGLTYYDEYMNKDNLTEYLELTEFKENGTINGIDAKLI